MAFAAGGYYPPTGFHFRVDFLGIGTDNDTRFQSVSGLSVEVDTETIREGGENRFEHTLPTRVRYPDLVLKRGMLTTSTVIAWCRAALQQGIFLPITLNVALLNEEHIPLRNWTFFNVWPKKWSVSDFNAEQNSVVVETLELRYNYFKVIP